jgi:hypothetical protein
MTNKNKSVIANSQKKLMTIASRSTYIESKRGSLIKSIMDDLRNNSIDGVFSASLYLDRLAVIEGTVGAARILSSQEDGWTIMRTSLEYSSWVVRIQRGLFSVGRISKGHNFSFPQNLSARCLAHAMSVHYDSFADLCGRIMVSFDENDNNLYNHWFMPFEPFMVKLFATWKAIHKGASVLNPPVNTVYDNVFASWEDEPLLSKALYNICDYHVEHSVEGKHAHAEFVVPPYNLFPIDILAIKRVREDLKLSWPSVSHPLLETPLARPPIASTIPNNEIIDRLQTVVPQVLPD